MVLVHWRDGSYTSGYEYPDDAAPYVVMWDCGFLLRDDADGIVLAEEIADEHVTETRGRNVHAIPRECIIEMWVLARVDSTRAP